MAFSQFPAPIVAAPSGINANTLTASTANTLFGADLALEPGIYSITCISSTNATVQFMTDVSTILLSATTVSGAVNVNIASAVTAVRISTNTGTNIDVTITLIGNPLTNALTGILDTLTTSGTYTENSTSGFAYVCAVGGGGGGAGGFTGNVPFTFHDGGGGGASGGVITGIVALTGSQAFTIGANGTGSTNDGTDGGATTFSTITALGGTKGTKADGSGPPSNGGAAVTGGGAGGSGGASGSASSTTFSFIQVGTTGGGGGGQYSSNTGTGAGSGIGTGGNGGSNAAGSNGTGNGSGGGGGNRNAQSGGNGTAGIIYVVRY
jgi:hypothetical protein